MTKQLEVIQQKDAIKDSVTEAQKNDVDNFVKAFEADKKKGESKPEQIINIFNDKGTTILDNIIKNIENIDAVNIAKFNAAALAFETDLTEYSKKNGGEVLGDEILKVADLKIKIQEKDAENINKIKDEKIKTYAMNINYETQNAVAEGLFEGNKAGFETIMASLYSPMESGIKEIGSTTDEEVRFTKLLKLYTKEDKESQKITNIKIGKCKDFPDTRFKKSQTERMIEYQDSDVTDTDKTKRFVRGKEKDLQTIAADNFIPGTLGENGTTTYDISQFSTINRTKAEEGINTFDDKGNYIAFGRFLEAKGSTYVQENIGNIISNISTYEPKEGSIDKKDNKKNELQNGYGNTLTEYVLRHIDVLPLYCTYLTPANMNILGGDEDTRVKNFNKLADSQDFQAAIKTLTEDQQKEIVNLRASLEGTKKSDLKESIKTIGKMIASLMMMFGLGKGSLKKWLPQSMRKEIDDIYKKEFELKEAEKDAIKNITEDLKLDATETLGVTTKDNEKSYKAPKRADLKITTITAESIEKTKEGKTYYEYIDPKIIRKGIEFYNNKHENAKVTESNFITKRNKKEEPNISGIKKNKEQFNEILNLLIENDDTWKAIAEANEKIATLGTKKLKDGTTAEYSEFFEKTEDRFGSVITSKKDVGTYLLTYLFAGSKNLSYTITENNLINGDTSSYTEKPETTTSTLTYIDENTDFTDKKINATGEAKNIEKVINMTNAPEKITVTRKDGTVVKGIKSTTYTDATDKTAITTYVLESDSKTRVDLNEGDSIAAVVETANTTTKTLNITAEYLKDGVLTGVSEKRIDEIMVSYADAPDNLLITPKGEKTAKKIQKGTVQIGGVDTPTYVYTDTPTKRVTINDGDKIEATTETTTEVAINTTWETIDTNLNDTKKSTEKINFEKTDYALDDKNTYQKEIIKLSELFTDKDNYKKLIADKITIEDIASVTNITHLKNMFTYRKLKSTNETENETFKLVKDFHYDKLTNIDPTKQTYEVTATEKDGIQITAKEGSTKKFTITIKNTDGKMSTGRKDETTV